MDMITDVKEKEPDVVKIDFVPLSPLCPIAFKLVRDIRKAVTGIEGVTKSAGLKPRSHIGRIHQ